jgi:hypothetical protein
MVILAIYKKKTERQKPSPEERAERDTHDSFKDRLAFVEVLVFLVGLKLCLEPDHTTYRA